MHVEDKFCLFIAKLMIIAILIGYFVSASTFCIQRGKMCCFHFITDDKTGDEIGGIMLRSCTVSVKVMS